MADILGLSAGAEPADHERLVLFQLPSLLPAPPPSVRPHAAVKAEHGGRQLQKNRSDSLGSSPTERAASADQLPSGKVRCSVSCNLVSKAFDFLSNHKDDMIQTYINRIFKRFRPRPPASIVITNFRPES